MFNLFWSNVTKQEGGAALCHRMWCSCSDQCSYTVLSVQIDLHVMYMCKLTANKSNLPLSLGKNTCRKGIDKLP